jgi:hypothetical protein
MKRTVLIINLLIVSLFINAQGVPEKKKLMNIPILAADTLVKGIYMSFSEFQQNAPSIRTNFRSEEEYLPINNIYDNMLVNRLLVLDSKGSFSPFKKSHWGICDGRHVFINYKGKYQKISLDGKYCPFSASVYSFDSNQPTAYLNHLLNATNGETTEITLRSFKELLEEEDLTLYKAFDQEQKKRMMMYTYLNMLNQTFIYR